MFLNQETSYIFFRHISSYLFARSDVFELSIRLLLPSDDVALDFGKDTILFFIP